MHALRSLPPLVFALALGALPPTIALAQSLAPAAPPPGGARPRVCLVLSGGGARGAAHIGVLKVLEELRVPVDCVVGTSIGALVGAAYASGLGPDRIEKIVEDADWDALLTDQPARAERSVYAKEVERARVGSAEVGLRAGELVLPQGVLVGHELQFFLQSMVRAARTGRFDGLAIPYRAIATDFESGNMTVLHDGDLATAMRASMSVPGAFAPVEIDGRLLVDGGLVRNLGVDVARSLGADAVIAVNVGTPLLKRTQLTSLLSAAEQTLNILTEQNVQASVASLGERDVLISPELGDITASEFRRAPEAIPLGALAARAAEDRLRRYAVSEDEYAAWRTLQRRDETPPKIDRVRVDTSGLRYVTPASVTALVGESPTAKEFRRGINQLLGTDDFQRIDGHYETTPEGTTFVLRPLEKAWGPNYLRFGVALGADFSGESDVTASLDHRATWLNSRGLEWRNRASVGQTTGIASELREPIDLGRRWYVAPRVEFQQDQRNLYVDDDAVATYRNRRSLLGFALGRRLGNAGELRVGFEGGETRESRVVGGPDFPDLTRRTFLWHGELVLDRLDSLDFPQSGYLVQTSARLARRLLGGDDKYDLASLEWQQAFGGGTSSVLLSARMQSSLGSTLPLYDAFSLGGFLNLSGFQRDEILAERVGLLRAIYRHRVGEVTSLLPGLYLGASLEGADVSRALNGIGDGHYLGGSLFLSAESVLGPFYLGVGFAQGGRTALYLYVGRP